MTTAPRDGPRRHPRAPRPRPAALPAPAPAAARVRRAPGAGAWAALLLGAWLGRVSSALPAGVEDTIDAVLPFAAAAAIALSFRRWLRRRVQQRSRGERA